MTRFLPGLLLVVLGVVVLADTPHGWHGALGAAGLLLGLLVWAGQHTDPVG